jgi:plasmid stability protein
MAKLYLENVSNDLYESLRERARSNRRSISAEALSLLEQLLPTSTKVRRRTAFYRRINGFV